jgi:hypothetical protein
MVTRLIHSGMAGLAVNGAMRDMIEPCAPQPDCLHVDLHHLGLSNREGLIYRHLRRLKIVALDATLCILAEENSQCFLNFVLDRLVNSGDQGLRLLTRIPALRDEPP